jgi:hypothetical protein
MGPRTNGRRQPNASLVPKWRESPTEGVCLGAMGPTFTEIGIGSESVSQGT